MIIARRVLRSGAWAGTPADRLVLELEMRNRRRRRLTATGGLEILLDLAEPARLRDGDALVLDDERLVVVEAAAEPLAEIGAADAVGLARIAWHLGNRHLPTQLVGDRLRIRRDPVIEDMVRRLGGSVTPMSAPFDPEGGAYSEHHHHS